MKQNKSEKGITLIALIITIIIMIILAAVSIKEIVGENSIITAAEKAATDYVEAEKEEQEVLQNIFDQAEYFTSDKASDVITVSNYGDSVNYSAGGVTDWKIFYNDGAHIFLIASDYVNITDDMYTAMGATRKGVNVYWADSSSFIHTGAEEIDAQVAKRFMLNGWYNSYPHSTNDNAKMTAALMDQSIWNYYIDSTYADYAIAGPTLEMYVASWNEVYPSDKIYTAYDSVGYYIGDTPNPTTRDVHYSVKSGYNNTLYYPYQASTTINGETTTLYWLASPATADPLRNVGVSSNGVVGNYVVRVKDGGVRPVVCLKSRVTATQDSSNIWQLSI